MAISRDKKNVLVSDLTDVLSNAKLTAFAAYQGLTVAEVQQLRREARAAGVTIKVVKNRLVRVAMKGIDTYKDTDTTALVGQLIYAVSDSDEVAPAKVLDTFAKSHPLLQLVGGFSAEGAALSTEEIKALAGLPSRDELLAQTIAQLLSPIHDTTNALSGNLHALLDGVEAKAAA